MAPYWDAERLILDMYATNESLTSRLFAAHWITQDKSKLYALICEATKWSKILSQVVEETEIIREKYVGHFTYEPRSCNTLKAFALVDNAKMCLLIPTFFANLMAWLFHYLVGFR